MTALDLYKYITNNSIEYRWQDNDGNVDVMIYPYIFQLEEFCKLLSPCLFDDGGIQCTLMDGYVAIWMDDICSYYEIDINKIFN